MNFHISDHANTRFKQRGIEGQVFECLLKYGADQHAPGGADKISITRQNANKIIRALKKEIALIERAQKVIVVQKGGSILTGYHRE